MTWPNGEIYEGEWKGGFFHGQGTYILPGGRKHVGQFKNGLLDGKGTMTNKKGGKYLGKWKKSQIWNASYYDKDGNIIQTWLNGVEQK